MYIFNVDIISYYTFNELKNVVSLLKDFAGILCKDSRIPFSEDTSDKEEDHKEAIIHSILKDIAICFKELNYSFSVEKYEAQCIMTAYIYIEGYTFEYNDLIYLVTSEEVYSRNGVIRGNVFKGIKALSRNVEDIKGQGYQLFNILQFDHKLQSKYLTLLHRFIHIVVKSNHSVTDNEKKWLDNLTQKREGIVKPFAPNVRNDNVKSDNNSTQNGQNNTQSEDPFKELSDLIGLSSVKEEINNLSNLVKVQKIRESRGMKTSSVSYHCVFTGNPGTGKTTVARIVAEIYKQLGVLKKGHLIETDRSGLVAEYVGQTAPKTNAIIDSALDGVLFIDEAYSLVQGGNNDYGKEAIATLLKRMEDDRDRLVVILAGYTKEMSDFIISNPGLQSRFSRYIDFPDYNANDLMRIFEYNTQKNEFLVSERAKAKIMEVIQDMEAHKDQNFGNARFVRNLFEKIIAAQANRLAVEGNITNEKLSMIEEIDVIAVLGSFFSRKQIDKAEKNIPQKDASDAETEWNKLITKWKDLGWNYSNVSEDGFLIKLKDDIIIDFGYYDEQYYMQARYNDDSNFSKQMKSKYGGRRSYGYWWKYLDAPFDDIKRGSFMEILKHNNELQIYVDNWVDKLIQDVINYQTNQTI